MSDGELIRTESTETFIQNAKMVHGDKYTYEKAVYIKTKIPITITCPIHGDFVQTPNAHLAGNKCPNCRVRGYTQQQFLDKSNIEHGGKYTYEKTVYAGSTKKVIITCPLHGDFTQQAAMHIRGNGCPQCAQIKKVHGIIKPVYRHSRTSDESVRYESMTDASKQNNVHISSISECCCGDRKSAGGYRWSFAEKDPKRQ